MEKTKIGVVGCGDISGIYLTNLTTKFANTRVVGVYDLVYEKAEKAAGKFGVPKKYGSLQELLADPDVEIVLNLTRPYQHHEVTMAAIEAGKHVYSEKPLGASLEEALEIKDAAKNKGVQVAGAPDTFLGAGSQTCRKLVDSGFIGKPVGASAFFACPGHERWHPDPDFYYQYGGGPVFDMGPYYITALVNLLGPVKSVSGMGQKTRKTRTITASQKFGETIQVNVDTHIAATLSFECGAICTMMMSFDVLAHNLPILEVYGTEGTLAVPDPNTFGGPVKLFRREQSEFLDTPLTFLYHENSRGLGLADMALAIKNGGKPRAGIELFYHVFEIMASIQKSSDSMKEIKIDSRAEKPEPMPPGILE